MSARLFSFGIFFSLLLFLSAGVLLANYARESRNVFAVFFARVIQLDLNATPNKTSNLLRRLDTVATASGSEYWLVGNDGAILSSTHRKPLPLPWSELAIPDEEFKVAWSSRYGFGNKLAVVRLVAEPAKFMVVLYGQQGSMAVGIFFFTIFFCIAIVSAMSWYATRILKPTFQESIHEGT